MCLYCILLQSLHAPYYTPHDRTYYILHNLWAGALTVRQSQDLQRVERAALAIITNSSPRRTSYTVLM